MATFGSLGSLFNQAQPNLGFFTTGALLALVIDASFQFAIAFLLFGVIPASIRRLRRRNQTGIFGNSALPTAKNVSLLLLPIAAIATSIVAADLSARSTFTDTSAAEEARTAREALERLSAAQRESFASLKQLPGEWNDLSLQWVRLYNDSNIGMSEFAVRAQPVVDNMELIIGSAVKNQELLVGSEAEPIYRELVAHYSAKLEAVQGMTAAIAAGDSGNEQRFGEQLADLNTNAPQVYCTALRSVLESPFAGGFSETEYQRGLEQLASC